MLRDCIPSRSICARDANGNTLAADNRTNTWDSQNRLTRCVRTVNDVTTTSNFTYGSDGLRRSMTVQKGDDDAITTHYLLDGQSVVQEFRDGNSNGTIEGNEAIATYLAGPRGVEYRQDASGARSWYLYDGLGSVIAEVNEGNASTPPEVTASRTYDVYGAVRPSTVAGSSESSHKFCGGLGHTADDTGLTYMRARYYDPAIGRFISEDPARSGSNWYSYCVDDPVNGTDSTGKFLDLLLTFFIGEDSYEFEASVDLQAKKCMTRKVAQIATEYNARLEAVFRSTLGEDCGVSAMIKVKDIATGLTTAVYHVVWDPFTMEIIHQHLH